MTVKKPETADAKFYRPNALVDEDFRLTIPEAVYRKAANADEDENPWLLALEEPISSKKMLRRKLTSHINVTDADRAANPFRRMQLLMRTRRSVQPLSVLLHCYNQIVLMLYEGYAARNPMTAYWQRERPKANTLAAAATGLAWVVLGRSGLGKSTAVEAALSLIQPAFEHVRFEGKPFSRYQILHLKVNCVSNAKAFYVELIRAIDLKISTSYASDLQIVSREGHVVRGYLFGILETHGVGLLCIDDLQHLLNGKKNDQEAVLETLTRIVNVLKIPLVVIGTEAALPLLTWRFDLARRMSGLPTLVMHPMPDGPEWNAFCVCLWAMRLVRVEAEMSEWFPGLLLDLSRGIPDLAVKLMHFAQYRSLAFGEERLDEEQVRDVYDISLTLVRGMLSKSAADPFANYGSEHLAALDAENSPSVLAALSAPGRGPAASTGGGPVYSPKSVTLTSGPSNGKESAKSIAAKARKIEKGGPICQLVSAAQKEGRSAHEALKASGVIWDLGAETAKV